MMFWFMNVRLSVSENILFWKFEQTDKIGYTSFLFYFFWIALSFLRFKKKVNCPESLWFRVTFQSLVTLHGFVYNTDFESDPQNWEWTLKCLSNIHWIYKFDSNPIHDLFSFILSCIPKIGNEPLMYLIFIRSTSLIALSLMTYFHPFDLQWEIQCEQHGDQHGSVNSHLIPAARTHRGRPETPDSWGRPTGYDRHGSQ